MIHDHHHQCHQTPIITRREVINTALMVKNFKGLSNRLFDIDESLKKVANVFPSEDEMESLER